MYINNKVSTQRGLRPEDYHGEATLMQSGELTDKRKRY